MFTVTNGFVEDVTTTNRMATENFFLDNLPVLEEVLNNNVQNTESRDLSPTGYL
jgi:hypothetical protein